VFADIDEHSYCIDPKSVELLINPKTKAIIAVDIFGQSSNIEQLKKIASKHNLKIISDTAQAIGATRNNKFAGTLADVGGISLNYHKHIHTGEGAVMFTNDDELALRLKLIRNHAESVVSEIPFEVNLVNMVGHNYRLSEIQAAIGRVQLKKLSRILSVRKNETELLRSKLIKFDEIALPFVDDSNTHVYYMYAMQLKPANLKITKSQFINELTKLGVPGLSSKYINLHLLPIFQNKIAIGKHGFPWTYDQSGPPVSYTKGICPVAEKLQDETYFSFYINDFFITKSEINFIYKSFEKVIRKYSQFN
jgi:dTDP-4-amino-4,6-dideoxygalactose transaminase